VRVARWFQPGLPGLVIPQKAPGGSRGTPGRMPSRVPCDVSLNREITCRHPACMAGWFSCPESPGFHPGLLGMVTGPIPDSKDLQNNVRKRIPAAATPCRADPLNIKRRQPGDSGSHAFPGAMRCEFEPGNYVPSSGMHGGVVFMPGVPGFPPGASWHGDGTDALVNASTQHDSQPYSWGGGRSNYSAQPQKA